MWFEKKLPVAPILLTVYIILISTNCPKGTGTGSTVVSSSGGSSQRPQVAPQAITLNPNGCVLYKRSDMFTNLISIHLIYYCEVFIPW